ncbi:MAG: acetyl-CoA carboxylase biotin carboxylase subunit [Lachnospiraceae bacterium]|nr:acetyl-CoA carboxylase biotin carboxylase subunit [Lachnospiraceae bacterium]
MFKKILIANRGEIAVRIIRACYEMGIRSVAVYSEADGEALHVQMADEAVCIGGSAPKDSYLNIQNILSAAVLTGSEAIHPGYGFLSENAKFAEICEKCNICFIGAPYKVIAQMGNKMQARCLMMNSGIPVIPGSDGILTNVDEAKTIAEKIGFPLLIKASAGGGGRGIRRVDTPDELADSFYGAKSEALACFGDDSVYIEKLMKKVRHIEIQILADKFGNTVHLFERDCSMQRRHQKVIEEAPSLYISDELRNQMGEAAIRAAKACGYINAGTVEFLVDSDRNFYFIEMNTRVQVEHPVTEAITGIDIIDEQIRIASGLPLSFAQDDVRIDGHAIECRINAENPRQDFMPSCGKVNIRHLPGGIGIRFESLLYDGWEISPYYDSMVGKLIVHAPNRDAAVKRMKRALMELYIEGVDINDEFLMEIIMHQDFQSNGYDTSWIEEGIIK